MFDRYTNNSENAKTFSILITLSIPSGFIFYSFFDISEIKYFLAIFWGVRRMQTKNSRFVDDLSTNFHCRCVWIFKCVVVVGKIRSFFSAFKIQKLFEKWK
jgi:hypothetical protein